MKKNRITFFGWVDYSVATFEQIIEGLHNDYFVFTGNALRKLNKLKEKVRTNFKSLEDAGEIIDYIDYFIILFNSFIYDFERLLTEVPKKLEDRHIDIIEHIYKRSRSDEKNIALEFKREHIIKKLKDESLRPLLDEIYVQSRGLLLRYKNLFSLSKRLRTFISSRIKEESIPVHEEEKKARIQAISPFPAPSGASWGDITIRFLSREAAELIAGKIREGRDFREMGFMDRRTHGPDRLWFTLLYFGKHRGEISWETVGITLPMQKNLKSYIKDIRKRLKFLFQLEDDPFKNYRRERAYVTKFRIELLSEEIFN